MDILYAAAEMVPYAKVGGLADVAGALTKELALRNHCVRALLPVYPSVRHNWSDLAPEKVGYLGEATLYMSRLASGLELILIEHDRLFDRPNP